MRLTCPNCDAEYEVPDEVIPTSGRDVQCSNCGKTWFQHHPDHVPDTEDEEIELSPTAPDPDEEVSPAPPPLPPAAAQATRRELDPEVAEILRQEAEAEFEARRKRQTGTLESQPDLGLDDGPPHTAAPPESEDEKERRAEEARRRMARMRGEAEGSAEDVAKAAAISSRRELLPDIEEINSTLRKDSSPHGVDAETREGIGSGGELKRKRGFKRGLVSTLALFVVAMLFYVLADQIAQAIPALDRPMASYVAWVDNLRISLDARLKSALGTLDSIASETAN